MKHIWTYANIGGNTRVIVKNGKDIQHLPELDEKLWKEYFQHEGIVVRTTDYDKDNHIGCSFKVKNLEYAERGLAQISKDCKTFLDTQ